MISESEISTELESKCLGFCFLVVVAQDVGVDDGRSEVSCDHLICVLSMVHDALVHVAIVSGP